MLPLNPSAISDALASIRADVHAPRNYIKVYHVTVYRGHFKALALALGVPSANVETLSDSALHSIYTVTLSKGGPEAAREMAERRFVRTPSPAERPLPAPASPAPEIDLDAFREQLRAELSADLVAELERRRPRVVRIENPAQPAPVEIDNVHPIFAKVLDVLSIRRNAYICGPAGSFKTTMGGQLAEALGLTFYSASSVADPGELLGFVSPLDREYKRTAFRNAFEHGGLFLFDEMDNSDPQALTVFNMALANDGFTFPDRYVKKHPNFRCVAATNTDGKGGDGNYIRNVLDGATLDRFVRFHMPYDEALELQIAPCPDWTAYVQKIRAIAQDEGIAAIISPRASIMGGELVTQRGWTFEDAAEHTLFFGMSETERNRIMARA